ncbi:CHRNA7 [Mytilus coruscus]|uniref:CHRNA7 n=1 Tax=Mytilus coruscus TaxID=42192 RepID=A0A6J8ENC2_MYTCO|nr:CHRNA7 [Mytilus coruscus]
MNTRLIAMDVLYLTIFISMFGQINTETLNDSKRLYEKLLTGYKKQLFPLENSTKPLEVGLSLWLKMINDFNDVNEVLTIVVALRMNWTDPSLRWNPKDYGNTDTLRIPSADIWIPWVYVLNSVDTFEPIGKDATFLALICSNGSVTDAPGAIIKSNCPTDMSKFPFDVQTCTLKFIMWSAGPAFKLTSNSDELLMDFFIPNAHWNLVNHKAYVVQDKKLYTYNIDICIQRKPLYFTVIIILPILLLCLLNPLVFIFPIESGERMGLAITVLLTFAFFLTIAANVVPTSSSPMCFLLCMIFSIITISGFIIIGVIISARCHYVETFDHNSSFEIFFNFCCIRKNGRPLESKKLHGKDVAKVLDILFCTFSYVLIFISIITYIFFVKYG